MRLGAKSAYGLQWNRFRIVRPEEDRATFRNRTGLTPDDLAGASCSTPAAGWAVTCGSPPRPGPARRRDRPERGRRGRPRPDGRTCPASSVVRGDLLRLPFAAGRFDQIYSLGVLDHTPDPRAAFLGLARLLKPGRPDRVWVYPRERPALERIMRAPPRRLDPAAARGARRPEPADRPRSAA